MNENARHPAPELVEQLAKSVTPRPLSAPVATLVLRARRLAALERAAEPLLGERWAHELAAASCAAFFMAEDAAEARPFEDVLADAVEHRWRHAAVYTGWKLTTFARSLRIYTALLAAWKEV